MGDALSWGVALLCLGLPWSSAVKNLPGMQEIYAGNVGSIPGSGRSHAEGNGNPLHILAYILAWAISRTEEPGGLQSAKQLDMTCRLNNKTVIPLHYNTEFFYFKP